MLVGLVGGPGSVKDAVAVVFTKLGFEQLIASKEKYAETQSYIIEQVRTGKTFGLPENVTSVIRTIASQKTADGRRLKPAVIRAQVAEYKSILVSLDDLVPKLTTSLHVRLFSSGTDLTNWVTARWQGKWFTTLEQDVFDQMSPLLRRPFFAVLSVEASLSNRWPRWEREMSQLGQPSEFKHFLKAEDQFADFRHRIMETTQESAHVRIMSDVCSAESLLQSVRELILDIPSLQRPSWDEYFIQLAHLASRRCNCMKRRVGCVLVRDKRVLSTGYNGTPRNAVNCNDGGCARCNAAESRIGQALDTCLCLHAEENALLEAGRERVGSGAILYCTTCPCLTCSVKIAQVGIAEVVYSHEYGTDDAATKFLINAKVKIRQYIPNLGQPRLYGQGEKQN